MEKRVIIIITTITIILIISLFLIFNSRGNSGGIIVVGKLELTSNAFENNGLIPSKYTCDGEDINPSLKIGKVPFGTKSLVLIVDDPDAPGGTWTHWVVINIDPKIKEIGENSIPGTELMNSFQRTSYSGPCPPSGEHRYIFKVFALDTNLEADSNADKKAVENAIQGHVLAQSELIGLYKKS